jgi:hypothetical protein
MGNFYTNFTLRGPKPAAVAKALAGRNAFVTPEQDGCVVVFDEQSDEQDQDTITELASRLSETFRCPVLAVLNHDDDIFWYQLYENGELSDEYDSSPGYFEETEELPAPTGGDAQKLCRAFGAGDPAAIEVILRKSAFEEEGYVFAFERHSDLVKALGIPSFGVAAGYGYISSGNLPEDLEEEDLIRVN